MDREKIIQFNEPHISGGDSLVTVSVGKAIDFAKRLHPKADKMTDDMALDFFMVTNYAWYVDNYGEGECLDRHI